MQEVDGSNPLLPTILTPLYLVHWGFLVLIGIVPVTKRNGKALWVPPELAMKHGGMIIYEIQ
jgi:hypothetical protein